MDKLSGFVLLAAAFALGLLTHQLALLNSDKFWRPNLFDKPSDTGLVLASLDQHQTLQLLQELHLPEVERIASLGLTGRTITHLTHSQLDNAGVSKSAQADIFASLVNAGIFPERSEQAPPNALAEGSLGSLSPAPSTAPAPPSSSTSTTHTDTDIGGTDAIITPDEAAAESAGDDDVDEDDSEDDAEPEAEDDDGDGDVEDAEDVEGPNDAEHDDGEADDVTSADADADADADVESDVSGDDYVGVGVGGLHLITHKTSITIGSLTFSVNAPTLTLCSPAALTLVPNTDTPQHTLEQLIPRIFVDVISATRFPYAHVSNRDSAYHDTIWYEQLGEDRLQYTCPMKLPEETAWLNPNHVPAQPYTMQAETLDQALNETKRFSHRMFVEAKDEQLHPHRRDYDVPHGSCNARECVDIPKECTVHVRRLAFVVTRTPPQLPPEAYTSVHSGCVSGYSCDAQLGESTCVERCGCAYKPETGCYQSAKIVEYVSPTPSPSPDPDVSLLVAPFVPDTSSPIFTLRLSVHYKAGDCVPIPFKNKREENCELAQEDGVVVMMTPMLVAARNTPQSCAIPVRADEEGIVSSGLPKIALHRFNSNDECYPLLHAHYVPSAQHFGLFDDLAKTVPMDGGQLTSVIEAVAGVTKSVYVKALNHAYSAMRNPMQNGYFFARLSRPDRLVNADVSVYKPELDAYEVTFEVREPGKYILEVYLGWVYGNQPNREGPLPLVIGPHMGHMFRLCPCRRSAVFGGPFIVNVKPSTTPLQVFGDHKCSGVSGVGRWVLLDYPPTCQPPVCTSSHDGIRLSIGNLGWSGEPNPWVWVPYDCYYHLYSCNDIAKCSAHTDLKWLLIQGDSQVRELLGHIHLQCGYSDVFGKFAALERANLTNGLRLSYYFQDLAYDSRVPDARGVAHPFARGFWQLMHHFNILPDCASGLPLSQYTVHPTDTKAPPLNPKTIAAEHLDEPETTRPNVFVFNAAMAYAAQDMMYDDFAQWLADASIYLRRAKPTEFSTNLPPPTDAEYAAISGGTDKPVPEQCDLESKQTPLRALWYTAPYIFSQAHSHSEHLTSWRAVTYWKMARKAMEELGIPVVDTFRLTQSRWEDSYDGLHYSQSTIEDPGHGLASAMAQQAVLNAIFPTCSGSASLGPKWPASQPPPRNLDVS